MNKSIFTMTVVPMAWLACVPFAFASSTLKLKMTYVESVDSTNALINGTGQYATPLTNGGTIPAGMVASTDRHRFAYIFSISGQAADESLEGFQTHVVRTGWNTSVPYNVTASLTGFGSFQNPAWDPPDDEENEISIPERNLFFMNNDGGTSTTDYETLRLIGDGNSDWYAAHHFNPGESGDYYLARMTFSLATPNTPGIYSLKVDKEGTGNGWFVMWKGGTESTGAYGSDVSFADYSGNIIPGTFTITVVPEPATLVLMAFGLPAIVIAARRRMRRQ